MKKYTPTPIDTGEVVLSDDLIDLTEMLAKNTHDVWAVGRLKEGWSYGETRNDALKQTPCLVPYEELSESERAYDINSSMETLKLIIRLGYKIVKEDKDNG